MVEIWNTFFPYSPSHALAYLARWRYALPMAPILHRDELGWAFLFLTLLIASFGLRYVMTTRPVDNNHDSNPLFIRNFGANQGKPTALLIWDRWRPASTERIQTNRILLLASIMVFVLALALVLGLGLHHVANSTPVLPTVDLGYAQYQGSSSNGVSRWLGIRYAAIPTGERRFAAPAPPHTQKGVQSAVEVGEPYNSRGTGLTEAI